MVKYRQGQVDQTENFKPFVYHELTTLLVFSTISTISSAALTRLHHLRLLPSLPTSRLRATCSPLSFPHLHLSLHLEQHTSCLCINFHSSYFSHSFCNSSPLSTFLYPDNLPTYRYCKSHINFATRWYGWLHLLRVLGLCLEKLIMALIEVPTMRLLCPLYSSTTWPSDTTQTDSASLTWALS